jgi:Rab GDP dissociation inhibitor
VVCVCICMACVQLWNRFKGNDSPPEHLGVSKEYNVDMVPKVC